MHIYSWLSYWQSDVANFPFWKRRRLTHYLVLQTPELRLLLNFNPFYAFST